MRAFASLAAYPMRAGTHGNSAFACILALDYARVAGDTALAAAIETVDDFSLACAAVAEHWLASFAVLALGDAP